MAKETHFINRSNWLRAAVLGANDGILSTTSLAIGVAAAMPPRHTILLAAVAGVVAGALSMAAGEYVSVSSQSDIERYDLLREQKELEETPEEELEELCDIYIARGVSPHLARQVAMELTSHNALEAHAREELGINVTMRARPFQAAFASALAFIAGGLLPVLVSILAPLNNMICIQYISAILFLALSGAFAARAGGACIKRSILRICLWGTIAMISSALVGHIFGISSP